MIPTVPPPRYFSTKFPRDCPWQNEKCPLHPSFHRCCWGWRSAGAKELLQEEEADPGHLDKSLQGSRPARLLPRDKREAALLRGTDSGLISSCAGAVTVSREKRRARGGGREGGGRDGPVSIPKCSREISPKQLLEEGATPLVYFTRGTGKRFFLSWSGKLILQKGPGGCGYYLGALRSILRCDEALTGPKMGIQEGREEPAKIADAGGKSLEGQKKGSCNDIQELQREKEAGQGKKASSRCRTLVPDTFRSK